jgi:hypothetical protein
MKSWISLRHNGYFDGLNSAEVPDTGARGHAESEHVDTHHTLV